jgi:hypothetical protein
MTAGERMRTMWRALVGLPWPLGSKEALSPVHARVSDEDPGWSAYGRAPGDRPYAEVYADLEDTLGAWRKNFMVRRVVNLTRSYAVGGGITFDSVEPPVADFVERFWTHPQNRISRRLGGICDTLTRDGEIFPILFTNPVDGMSYLRFKTARQIREVLTEPDDYETEVGYVEDVPDAAGRMWMSPRHPQANPAHRTAPPPQLQPVMLHWAVNKPVDGTRGESDLTPILPWALRYSEWLKDRVRLNRQRTRSGLLDVEVADDTQVEAKRHQLRRSNPIEAGIYVHGSGERVSMHNLEINASEAEQDGKVLRLAIATGANLGLHYLGEGEGTNYATAREMGEPTARFYADRQQEIVWMLEDLITVAYRRYGWVAGWEADPELCVPGLGLRATVGEVAGADSVGLAHSAYEMMQALEIAAAHGWVDDLTALSLALKFAGETMSGDQIRAMLLRARTERQVAAE